MRFKIFFVTVLEVISEKTYLLVSIRSKCNLPFTFVYDIFPVLEVVFRYEWLEILFKWFFSRSHSKRKCKLEWLYLHLLFDSFDVFLGFAEIVQMLLLPLTEFLYFIELLFSCIFYDFSILSVFLCPKFELSLCPLVQLHLSCIQSRKNELS